MTCENALSEAHGPSVDLFSLGSSFIRDEELVKGVQESGQANDGGRSWGALKFWPEIGQNGLP